MVENIRVIGYMPLFYGRHYLRQSLMSVINHVEKMVVLYTDRPSYGHGTTLTCPDTEEELLKIAQDVCGEKLIWEKVQQGTEGDHRGQIYKFSEGFDVCVAVDSDEVFCENDLKRAIVETYLSDKRYMGVGGAPGEGFINHFRGFSWCCYDQYLPIRFTNLKNKGGEGVVSCKIWHFSTAQPIETIRFKIDIHGHKDEIRKDWFEEKFLKFDPNNPETHRDLHIVAENLWFATPYDKTQMPQYLKDHPFYNLDIIE